MRAWGFVQVPERCGLCGAEIPVGSAAQEIELRGVKRKRYRGKCCAGAAPPNLPASPVHRSLAPLDLSRLDALIPNRTRGALKAMAHEHLPPESESALPAPLPRRAVSDLRVARQSPLTDRWLAHPDD